MVRFFVSSKKERFVEQAVHVNTVERGYVERNSIQEAAVLREHIGGEFGPGSCKRNCEGWGKFRQITADLGLRKRGGEKSPYTSRTCIQSSGSPSSF